MTDATDAIVGIIPTVLVVGLASKMIGGMGNDNRRRSEHHHHKHKPIKHFYK